MGHNFRNWDQALDFMSEATDPTVIGALCQINTGIQFCSGINIGFLRKARTPSLPLDLLWFYSQIALVLLKWDEPLDITDDELLSAAKLVADTRIDDVKESDETDLFKFTCLFLRNTSVHVDAGFCMWLFAETLIVPGILSDVFDGSIAREVERHANADFEEWAALWT